MISSEQISNNPSINIKTPKVVKTLPNFVDIKTISDYWLAAQTKINLADKIIFLKTHSALCTVENNPFTNNFSKKALKDDPTMLADAESIMQKYAGNALSNKNTAESAQFLKNLKTLKNVNFHQIRCLEHGWGGVYSMGIPGV